MARPFPELPRGLPCSGVLPARPRRRIYNARPPVEGELCGCVPTRPARTTPPIRFLFLASHLRSTLPSAPPARCRPGVSLVLRFHVYLDRGLSPPSSTTCTAHTPPVTVCRPTETVRIFPNPQSGGNAVQWIVRCQLFPQRSSCKLCYLFFSRQLH